MLIILLRYGKGVTNSFAERTSGDRSKRLNVLLGRHIQKPYKRFQRGQMDHPDVDDIERLKPTIPTWLKVSPHINILAPRI